MTTTTVTTTTTTTVTTTVTDQETKTRPLDYTHLIFVMDRSGSMEPIKDDAIGGFNSFIEEQSKVEGLALLTLVQFDHTLETPIEKVELSKVKKLTNKTYFPRGMTALNDAIGCTINKYRDTGDQNVKTIMAVLTDGAENSSKEYTGKAVADLVSYAEDTLGWDVLFLGANIDVTTVASAYNIKSDKMAQFTASGKGIGDSYAALNAATTSYRSMAVAAAAGDIDFLDFELSRSVSLQNLVDSQSC